MFGLMGYETKLTPKTNDFGVDVLAIKKDERIAIQVKKYSQGNNVGNDIVQKLLGAMQQKNTKANKGIIVTTSDFTKSARIQAEETPIELWNAETLKTNIKKYKFKT
ncbi:MAG: restriction endonuclease [Candidatus Diapherotrites archaeon]